jgi:tripartite-type tricarboxylate transporter receptor subunit TctC
VQNMPGAGGIRAANYIYNIAPRDGSVIGMIDQSLPLQQLLEPESMKTDVTKFNWVGRIASNSAILYAWHTAPVQKIEDAFSKELIVSSSGGNSRMMSNFVKNLLGMKFMIVTGYKGTNESRLAMQRGEVHALTQPWSALRAENAEWLQEKKVKLLMQVGVDAHPDLPGLPTVVDLARNEDERKLLSFMASGSRIGRSILSPPNQPPERVAALRAAFMATMQDEAFMAEITKLALDLDPISGEELQKSVIETASLDPGLIAKARKLAGLDVKN